MSRLFFPSKFGLPIMFKILLFFLFIFLSLVSFGQFNDSTHHHFSFASSGTINKTQETSSYVLTNATGYEVNKKRIGFNAGASWIYGQQDRKLSNNDVSFSSNLDYLKNVQKLYYWALLNFDESYSLKINYRVQSGIGLGYTFVNNPALNLVVSDGFLYESSDLTDPVLGKDVYQTVRNSFRVKYKWSFKNTVILQGTNFIQPSLLSLKDYILKFNNQLSVKLNKWLSINAAMAYNKISRTNRENLLITYGIAVDKYF
jgi:hypothetical protein